MNQCRRQFPLISKVVSSKNMNLLRTLPPPPQSPIPSSPISDAALEDPDSRSSSPAAAERQNELLYSGWTKPICIRRHAFGDQYRATDTVIKGVGKLKLVFVPEGSDEKTEFEVYNFTGAGGVALSMYNTDEV
ncbi:dehydrogenase [Lithospermum erythrorhizon]|uniref:Dehydrogenase n=1 Tax=Lithospermum erythrorhizon TaxID=34254 RepID=A0AAV3RA58_LITER